MDQQPVRYATLRDRRQWIGVTLSRLSQKDDGTLSLSAVPGPGDGKPILVAGPYDSAPSGIAIGSANDIFISDTITHQVVWQDTTCAERVLQMGTFGNAFNQFRTPCGLLIHANSLYVADSGNARVQVFRLPTFELRAVWEGIFHLPTTVAADKQGRIYVLDEELKSVTRFNASGLADPAYKPQNLGEPKSLALDDQNRLYVSDASSNQLLRFDSDGKALSSLPSAAASFRPRALAAQKDCLYVADAGAGRVWKFDITSNSYLAALPGYRGPVSALTIGPDDSLWIKPGLDQTYYRLQPHQAFIAAGFLATTDALDAGEETDWARVHVDADLPPSTSVDLRLISRKSKALAPNENDWRAAETLPLDTLVPPLATPDAKAGDKRFLWVRASITTDDETKAPRLFQIEAETTSRSYLDYLPAMYRRADADTGFLNRWLKIVQSDIDDWEARLEAMPRRFDPLMTPDDQLFWLATWLAFHLPRGRSLDELRALFARIPELQTHRGTLAGMRDLAELYTSVRPHIFEAFHTRRVWQLGPSSALGVDTTLPAASPEGMTVPGWSMADPELMGLRGDYYEGINFRRFRVTNNDPQVDFVLVTAPAPLNRSKDISVRWTGQLRPRSTDLYTFSVESTGGVRLWVDGRLIIDNWKIGTSRMSGRLSLTEGRWYAVVLEYFSIDGGSLHLAWLSRNQRKEIIPQERLYAIRDEHASLDGPIPTTDSSAVLVGQTVVGESQPLSIHEYGNPLFSDTAHLFTVSVPAASLRSLTQREDLRAVIDQEKPAHTDYHLCFVEPRMRIGFQSQIGIDSIIAGPPAPLSLEGTILGIESFLADDNTAGRVGRVGSHSHVGYDTVVG